MLRLVVLSAGLLAVQGQLRTSNVTRCIGRGVNASLPINAYVEGCVNTPCRLPQGSFATVHLAFKAPRPTLRMTTHAQAFAFMVPINYPLGEFTETCIHLSNSFCPVREDIVLQNTLRMKIEEAFPVGRPLTFEFRIEDDADKPIMCVRVPVVIAKTPTAVNMTTGSAASPTTATAVVSL
ncbi:hypothetical protein ABMA28_008934 [Loxostege sticticalis]|uniref:MD-2-related lipid-recognition domain-containing protein n=1 Tax=Loxostege sticticalis TaxID=481309 RepID=A0ABD0SF61_LOXSC